MNGCDNRKEFNKFYKIKTKERVLENEKKIIISNIS